VISSFYGEKLPFYSRLIYYESKIEYFNTMNKKKINTIVSSNKYILGGTPVFRGTRVPIKNLWDYLKAGDTLEDFLEGFPSVSRKQAIALINSAQQKVSSAG
jgi:uncharacterized protein (DUF433 family)